jgi:hypothetical protein
MQAFHKSSSTLHAVLHTHRSKHYPERCSKPGEASTSGQEQQQQHDQLVRFADIGCGFGGLLVK